LPQTAHIEHLQSALHEMDSGGQGGGGGGGRAGEGGLMGGVHSSASPPERGRSRSGSGGASSWSTWLQKNGSSAHGSANGNSGSPASTPLPQGQSEARSASPDGGGAAAAVLSGLRSWSRSPLGSPLGARSPAPIAPGALPADAAGAAAPVRVEAEAEARRFEEGRSFEERVQLLREEHRRDVEQAERVGELLLEEAKAEARKAAAQAQEQETAALQAQLERAEAAARQRQAEAAAREDTQRLELQEWRGAVKSESEELLAKVSSVGVLCQGELGRCVVPR
jgi:hypothetical protein